MRVKKEILLTVMDVSKILKINPFSIYRKAEKGEIPSLKIGKLLRFKESEIQQWIKDQNKRQA